MDPSWDIVGHMFLISNLSNPKGGRILGSEGADITMKTVCGEKRWVKTSLLDEFCTQSRFFTRVTWPMAKLTQVFGITYLVWVVPPPSNSGNEGLGRDSLLKM